MEKEQQDALARAAKLWVLPPATYFVAFCILTFPLISQFGTHFFTDTGDGLQNVWNIWWVNRSVTELHQSPWHTTYLHYPNGTSLLGQTLNPFNGFVGILLLRFLTLIQTHNAIILFSFVAGGVTAFWLSYSVTKSYWSSLVAGYIFTFSQYHFTHAEGHMQLVALEWIPLFLLCWYRLIKTPSIRRGLASAIVLFGVLLCDHYYFLFCVLAGILIVIWHAVSTRDFRGLFEKRRLSALGAFTAVVLLTSGVLVLALLRLNRRDPLLGSHDVAEFSLDLLAPFIPGGHWRFASLTKWYWASLPGNINESSVYLGLSVVFLIVYAWAKRKTIRAQVPSFNLWYLLLAFFGAMALGPVLRIAGKAIPTGIMPYDLLQAVIPPLRLSGCPVRMMVMVTLAASVISAIGLTALFERTGRRRIVIGGILGVMLIVEFLPKPLPATRISVPEYVNVLKRSEASGGVINAVSSGPMALYYQTIHEKPMADGYISRYPTSVFNEWGGKVQAFQRQEYARLAEEYDVRYLVASSEAPNLPGNAPLRLLHEADGIKVWQLERSAGDKVEDQ